MVQLNRRLYKFTINKNNYDGIQQHLTYEDGRLAEHIESGENIQNGYVPRHQWNNIAPHALKTYRIMEFTEAVESLDGYTIEVGDERTPDARDDGSDYYRWLKKEAVLVAAAHVLRSKKVTEINIYNPNGTVLIKTVNNGTVPAVLPC